MQIVVQIHTCIAVDSSSKEGRASIIATLIGKNIQLTRLPTRVGSGRDRWATSTMGTNGRGQEAGSWLPVITSPGDIGTRKQR
jgi:hypothetical protein